MATNTNTNTKTNTNTNTNTNTTPEKTTAVIEEAQSQTNLKIDIQGKQIKSAYEAVSSKLTDIEKDIALLYGSVIPKMDRDTYCFTLEKTVFGRTTFGNEVTAESVTDTLLARYGLKRIGGGLICVSEMGKHIYGTESAECGSWFASEFENDDGEVEHGVMIAVNVKVSDIEAEVYGLSITGKSVKKMARYVATAVKETGKKPSKKAKKQE